VRFFGFALPLFCAALLGALSAAGGCTDKPKVARAGVGEPTVIPSVNRGADSSKGPGTATTYTPPNTPVVTPTGTAAATTGTATSGGTAGNSAGNSAGNNTTGNGQASTSPGADGSQATGSSSGLVIPSTLPSAEQESLQHKAACESGNPMGCMRLGAYFASTGKRDDAIKAYMNACVRGGTLTPDACKAPSLPTVSDARGCYEAGLLMLAGADKPAAKNILQCACDKSFTQACEDVKGL